MELSLLERQGRTERGTHALGGTCARRSVHAMSAYTQPVHDTTRTRYGQDGAPLSPTTTTHASGRAGRASKKEDESDGSLVHGRAILGGAMRAPCLDASHGVQRAIADSMSIASERRESISRVREWPHWRAHAVASVHPRDGLLIHS